MTRGRLCWYRVEIGADGKIDPHRITAVDHADHDLGGIFFVKATSAQEAARLAFRLYQLADNRRRRARYTAEGRCPYCGRAQDRATGRRCSVCVEAHSAAGKRQRAKARGEVVEKPSTYESRQRNRETEREAHRLEVLREVHRRFLAAQGDRGAFARWLLKEIEALAGREVA